MPKLPRKWRVTFEISDTPEDSEDYLEATEVIDAITNYLPAGVKITATNAEQM